MHAAKKYYVWSCTLMYWFLVTANVVHISPILVTVMMMEALRSSEKSILTRYFFAESVGC
jgi:hypothetical protein